MMSIKYTVTTIALVVCCQQVQAADYAVVDQSLKSWSARDVAVPHQLLHQGTIFIEVKREFFNSGFSFFNIFAGQFPADFRDLADGNNIHVRLENYHQPETCIDWVRSSYENTKQVFEVDSVEERCMKKGVEHIYTVGFMYTSGVVNISLNNKLVKSVPYGDFRMEKLRFVTDQPVQLTVRFKDYELAHEELYIITAREPASK